MKPVEKDNVMTNLVQCLMLKNAVSCLATKDSNDEHTKLHAQRPFECAAPICGAKTLWIKQGEQAILKPFSSSTLHCDDAIKHVTTPKHAQQSICGMMKQGVEIHAIGPHGRFNPPLSAPLLLVLEI